MNRQYWAQFANIVRTTVKCYLLLERYTEAIGISSVVPLNWRLEAVTWHCNRTRPHGARYKLINVISGSVHQIAIQRSGFPSVSSLLYKKDCLRNWCRLIIYNWAVILDYMLPALDNGWTNTGSDLPLVTWPLYWTLTNKSHMLILWYIHIDVIVLYSKHSKQVKFM